MATQKAKLSEIKVGDTVLIHGMKHVFKGYEKRKTNLGRQEMFIFNNIEEKIPEGTTKERRFEKFNFSNILIKKIEDNVYEWN